MNKLKNGGRLTNGQVGVLLIIPGLAVFAAIILNQGFRGAEFLRGVTLVNWIIPGTAIGFLWTWIFNGQYGILNSILETLDILETGIPWLGQTNTALLCVVIARTWQMLPWYMAFLLGGLQSVSLDQVEAAHIDGANNWQTFWKVILPGMKQTAILVFILGLIGNLQHFDLPWTMTQGGPARATTTLSIEVYTTAFKNWNMGKAATVGTIWAVLLAYLLLTTGVSDLLYLVPLPGGDAIPTTSIFLSVLITLYLCVMSFGLDLWSLWTTRHLDPGVNALFQGFSVAGRVIWLNICVALQITVRLFPAVIALVLFYFLLSPLLLSAPVALICCTIPVMFALYYNIVLRYALAPYLLADRPDDGAGLAIRRSMELMRGWKWELFKLDFSFIGWLILLEGLRLLASCAALAGSGFFALLTQLPAADLPGLIPGYVVWLNDFSGTLGSFSDTQIQLFTLFSQVGEGTFASLLGDLFSLPLLLWLTPYRKVARAAFYDARQAMPEAAAQDLPPL